ncbi:MAG: MFS transporter, partial [bacterium]
KMLIISNLTFAFCYFLWIYSHSFPMFLLGFVFRTIGGTFNSGTLQAYVYDFLQKHHLTHHFEQIWGKGNALRTLGIGVAVTLGGFLSQVSYNLTLFLSGFSVLTLAIMVSFWPEIKSTLSTKESNYWQFLLSALKSVRHNPNLMHIIIYSGVIMSLFANLEEFNDLYLQFLGFPNYVIGLIFGLATVGQSLASLLAHRLATHAWSILNLTTFLALLILVSAAYLRHPLLAAGILFLGIILEFSNVIGEGIIQREVSGGERSTVASLNSFARNVLPFQLLFGLIATRYGLQSSYLVYAGIVGVYLIITVPIYGNRNSKL